MSPTGGRLYKQRNRAGLLAGLTVSLCLGQAQAAKLTLSAGVSSTQELSDNITNSSDNKQSEWISQITPRFGAKATGRHLTLSMDYQIQDVRYANDVGSDQQLHQLTLGANISAWNNKLNFDVAVTHSQQQVDEQGTSSSSAISVTDNTTNVGTVSLAPTLDFRVLDRASLSITPSYSEVAFQTAQNSGGARYGLTTTLSSIPKASLISWGLTHSYSEDTGADATFGSMTLNLGLRVGPKTNLFTNIGREGNEFSASNPDQEGSIWEVGVNWVIGRRTNLSASIGNRYFTRTHTLEFSHAMRHMRLNLSYNQDLTTTTALQLGEPVFDDTGTVLLGFGVPVESTEVFAVDNLQASLSGSYSKSSFGLTVSMQERTAQISLTNTTIWTLSASASHSFSSGMRASTSITTRASEFTDTGLESDFTTMSIGLSRSFPNNLSLSVNGQRQSQTTNTGDSDFTENSVSVTLGWAL